MIRRLRRRLTLLCAAMTGAFLVAGMLLALILTERAYEAPHEALFLSRVSQLSAQLAAGSGVSASQLAQLEGEGRMIVSIEDNGTPLFFPGAFAASGRAELLAAAQRRAEALGFDRGDFTSMESASEQLVFLLDVGDDSYRCAVTRLLASRGPVSLTVLADRAAERDALRLRRMLFAAFTLAALGGLGALSWLLAGAAVRPVQRGLERQNSFIASASHDLRSPLAGVSACAGALLAEPERAPDYARDIMRECSRLGKLLDELLALASAELGGYRLPRERVDLDTLLIEAVETLTPVAKAHGHALTLTLPGDDLLPGVWGSAARLRQAVINLISNAATYAGGDGPIEVTGETAGKSAVIRVVDHGAGIPDDGKKKVFDRFYRADQSRHDRAHFGLGLAFAREAVEQHGGRLRLYDTPGGGCTFVITLPARRRPGTR